MHSNLINKVKSNEYILNTLTLLTGTTCSQIIIVLFAPVLSRIYTPEEFGIFGFYLAFTSIGTNIATLKYELALVLPKNDKQAFNLLLIPITLSIIIFLISAFIYFCFVKNFSANNFIIYNLILTGILANAIFNIFISWNTRCKYYKNLSISRIIRTSGTLSVQFFSKLMGWPLNGLIFGHVTGCILGIFSFVINTLKKRKIKFIQFSRKLIFLNIIKYKDFARFQTPSVLINTISQYMPLLLFPILFSNEIAGFYAITMRVMIIPANLINQAIRQTYYQKATEHYNSNSNITDFFLNTMKFLAKVYLIPAIIIAIFAPSLFSLIFGKSWQVAGIYAQLSVFYFFFGSVNVAAVMSSYILGLQKFNLIYEILLLIARFLSIYFGYLLFNNSFISVFLFSMAGAIFNFIYIIIIFYRIKKIDNGQLSTDAYK